MKILYRVQAPSTSVQMQEASLLALWANILSLAARTIHKVMLWNLFVLKQDGLGLGFLFGVGFFWWFFFVPLQFSSTINLVLITSLVMTLHHASQQPCMLASKNSIEGCLCASLMMTKNVSLTQNVQKNMNDNPFSDYVKFSGWSVLVLGKNMSSNMYSLIL